jgi:hypothetical protein
VSGAKAKKQNVFRKNPKEKYCEEKIRKRTLFVRKRTLCAAREWAEKSPHPNISTQARVKMFHPVSSRFATLQSGQCNLAAAALTHLRP